MALGGEGGVCNVATCSTAHNAVRWWWCCCVLSLLLSHISPAMGVKLGRWASKPNGGGSQSSSPETSSSSESEEEEMEYTRRYIRAGGFEASIDKGHLGQRTKSPEPIVYPVVTNADLDPVTSAIDGTKTKEKEQRKQESGQGMKNEVSSKETQKHKHERNHVANKEQVTNAKYPPKRIPKRTPTDPKSVDEVEKLRNEAVKQSNEKLPVNEKPKATGEERST